MAGSTSAQQRGGDQAADHDARERPLDLGARSVRERGGQEAITATCPPTTIGRKRILAAAQDRLAW